MHPILSKIKHPRLRLLLIMLFYAAVLGLVIYFQTNGNYTTPPFIYQGF